MTPELNEHLYEWMGNNPQVVNSPISNDAYLVPDHKQSVEKVRVSKLYLQISIREIHNDLISESRTYQLKEEVDEITEKPLISDTALCEIIPKNVRKL